MDLFTFENIIEALVSTLLHSVWQITFLGCILYFILHRIPAKDAQRRFTYSLATMFLTIGIGVATFSYYLFSHSAVGPDSPAQSILIFTDLQANYASPAWSLQSYIQNNQTFILQLWLSGVLLFSLKWLTGFGYLNYLQAARNKKKYEYLDRLLLKVKEKCRIDQAISIYSSTKISTPMVSGWLKSTILIPLSVINHLEEEELEAVIAHEIAHIARQDWFISLFQALPEILFYYHPVIWWISNQIKIERENACDDWTISNGYNPIQYAKILLKVRQVQSQPNLALSLGLVGNKNKLLNRIQRLLDNNKTEYKMKNKLIIAALVLLGGIGLAFSPKAKETFDIPFLSKKNQEITADRQIALPQLTTQDLAVDTIPQKKGKSSATIIDNGRKIKIEKENGEITKMEVDGELIDPSEYDRYVDEFNGFDFNFDDDALGNFHFKGLPHGNMFFFKDKNQWPGFDEDEFAKMFEQLDSLHGFKFNFGPEFGQNFNFNFDLDSMMGPDFNLSEMMEKMQEGLKGIPFNHDFDFGNGFDFDQDFDFGPDFEFEDFDGFRHSGKISDRLGRSLNKDGLLKEGVENEVELTGKHLKINGEKQPSNIHEKYKDLFEEYSGIEVNEDSKIVLKIEGKKERSRGLRRI